MGTRRRNRILLPTGVMLAVCARIAQAQSDSAGNGSMPLPGVGQSDLWPSVARLFGSLVLVLLLAWGALWLLRRTLKGRWTGLGSNSIKVVERVYLAPRKSVEVVLIGRRILVLGVTDHQIGMLTELTPEDIGLERSLGPAGTGDAAGAATGPRSAGRLWQQARRRLSGGLSVFRLAPGSNTAKD
ncbi:MAG: flagellar biosynthetic protein FliO [Candidatus Zixiibacteriota bacterium]